MMKILINSFIWWLNFASDETTPYDNKPIALTDTFFEAIAIKDIEKQLYVLRTLYFENIQKNNKKWRMLKNSNNIPRFYIMLPVCRR